MAIIKIGSVNLPTPSEMSIGIQDLVKAERNTRGSMIIEHIAAKQKIELGWTFLTPLQLKTILTAIGPVFFSVTYIDPETNANRTAKFYKGDRTIPILDSINGNLRYKDFKFNIIEQ